MRSHRERGPTPVGPLAAWDDAPRILAAVSLLVASGACATAGPSPGPAEPEEPREPVPAEPAGTDAVERARAVLEEVRSALAAGDAESAAVAADSVYFTVRASSELGEVAPGALELEARALEQAGDLTGAASRLEELLAAYPDAAEGDRAALTLARLRMRRIDDPAAARTLLSRPSAAGDSARSLLRTAARGMSVSELEALADDVPSDGGPPDDMRAVVWAELAAARALAGNADGAGSAAERALGSRPREPDRRRARQVLDGRLAPEEGPVRIGLLLPASGRFEAVGRWLRQGAELALEGHVGTVDRGTEFESEDAAGTGPLDDRIRRLEAAGVVAILGPVRSDDLVAAAAARETGGLALVSPLATRAASEPATFTLWDRERRELDAAGALGRWMARDIRPGPVGALYPEDDLSRRSYLRFLRALEGEGAWLVAAESYDPEATTLEQQVSAVAAYGPRAVFAGAAGSASVLQMAPQLSYYGIRGALVVGGADWGDLSTIRRLDPSFSQFRVVAAYADRREEAGAWSRFRSAFEQTYRASLGDNMVPALGHDAGLLLALALDETRPVRPRALSRSLARQRGVEGATGRLRVTPGGGVARRVRLRAVRERELTTTSAAEARSWLASAGRMESARARSRRARALQAVREAGVPLTTSSGPGAEGGARR